MVWNHTLTKGQTYDQPVMAMDLFPTICHISGAETPNEESIDGVNLMPYILDTQSDKPHEYLFWQRGFSRAVRQGEFKLLINDLLMDTVLFNLEEDPYETNNILFGIREKAQSMISALNNWSSSLPEPLWPSVIYYEFMDGDHRYLFDQ